MEEYPKNLDQINDDDKLILLADEFEIQYREITMFDGGDENGMYPIEYRDFAMTHEELEEIIEIGLNAAKKAVAEKLGL